MKLKLGIHAEDVSFYKSCIFYSGRIRTLVAMATYNGKSGNSQVSVGPTLAFSSPDPRLIGELLVYRGIRRPSVVNIFKRLLL